MREDLPDPERPVTTTSLFFGILTLIFFRLLLLAPIISICLLETRFLEDEGEGVVEVPGINLLFGAVFVDSFNRLLSLLVARQQRQAEAR